MNDSKEYALAVEARIRDNNNEMFRNNCPRHAAIILQKFISVARVSVHIVCGKLSAEVFRDSFQSISNALQDGRDVRILITEEEAEERNIESLLLPRDGIRRIRRNGVPHFAVIDGIRFRIELDKGSRQAIACAYTEGDEVTEEYAQLCERTFASLWDQAQTMPA